ncbi:MAG: hypothetical protein DRJ64_04960 [Thermoprotei archaeon]|nr:MAG: hypothetical protein DRJ64_04960 [Thermoprotei archaeon]
MEPVKFKEANAVFGGDQEEYKGLPAHVVKDATGSVISCWELTPQEMQNIKRTGKIWVQQLAFGQELQPIFITTNKSDIYGPNTND